MMNEASIFTLLNRITFRGSADTTKAIIVVMEIGT